MMKNLSKKFIAAAVLIVLVFMGSAFFMYSFFKQEIIDQQQQQIKKEIRLFSSESDPLELLTQKNLSDSDQTKLKKFSSSFEVRITLLDKNTTILYDSKSTQKNTITGSRENRPEVRQVLSGKKYGSSLRYSSTLKEERLYVAKGIYDEKNQLIGVVRISETYIGFSAGIRRLMTYLILFGTILFLALILLLYLFFLHRDKPIRTLLPVLSNMLDHPEKLNTLPQESLEWQELYELVNKLNKTFNESYLANVSNEIRFNFLLKELMVGVFSIDEHQKISFVNPKMLELLDSPDNEYSGQNYLELFKTPALIHLIQKSLEEKIDIHQEVILLRPQEHFLDITIRYIAGNEQQPTTILGLAYDLTPIKQLEKMQQDFVSNVSHELKTPVTSLIGFTETLLDGAKDDPEILTQFLKIMEKDAQRLELLIQDILELSRGENNTYLENRTGIHPALIIQNLLKDHTRLIQQKQLKIELDIDENIEFTTSLPLFRSILKNLIENAIQYSSEKGQINILVKITENNFVFCIKDTGIGIAPDEQERIFERFYRADKTRNRHTGGTGLGLAIVKHYVHLLNGTITVDSYLGIGSTFIVKLPLTAAAST